MDVKGEEMKTLVVVYSRSGKTLSVAKKVAEELDADLEVIEDKVNRKGVLGFLRSGYEALTKKLPPIAEPKRDPGEYELTVVGTPIWAGRMSSPVRAYLSRTKSRFKRVAFFCTSEGGGHERVFMEMGCVAAAEPIATLELTGDQLKGDQGLKAARDFARKLQEAVS